MKYNRLLIFVLLFISSITNAQIKIATSTKQDFNTGITLLKKEHLARKDYPAHKLSDSCYALADGMLQWAQSYGTKRDVTIAQYYKLEYLACRKYGSIPNLNIYIAEATKLLNDQDILETPQSIDFICDLIVAYDQLKLNAKILELYPMTLELIEKYGSPTHLDSESFYSKVSSAYYRLGYYKSAIGVYKKAVETSEKLDGKSSFYNNIGLAYYNLGLEDSALFYYTLGRNLLINNKEEIEEYYRVRYANLDIQFDYDKNNRRLNNFLLLIESNMADLYILQGKYDQALEKYQSELQSANDENSEPSKAISATKIAETYYLKGNYKQAEYYLKTAESAKENIETPSQRLLQKYNLLKAKILLVNGHGVAAERYFQAYQKRLDSIKQKESETLFKSAEFQYKLQKEQYESNRSRDKIKMAETSAIYQKVALFTLCLVIIGLVLFSRKIIRDKQQIAQQKIAADNALRIKNMLLKEVHHRVKNNLQAISSLLKMHSKKVNNADFNSLVKDSSNHLQSMSLVHQLLYQRDDFSTIYSKEYINKLSQSLLNAQGYKDIDMVINCENIELSIDKAIPMGLLLTELITNSLKHAFTDSAGEISIGLIQSQNKATLTYGDNGKGMLGTIANNSRKSVGFKLIKLLTEEMQATSSMTNNSGLNFTFTFSPK